MCGMVLIWNRDLFNRKQEICRLILCAVVIFHHWLVWSRLTVLSLSELSMFSGYSERNTFIYVFVILLVRQQWLCCILGWLEVSRQSCALQFSQVLCLMELGLSEGEVQCVLAGSSSPQHWPDFRTGLSLTVDQEKCTCSFPSPFYSSLTANWWLQKLLPGFFWLSNTCLSLFRC